MIERTFLHIIVIDCQIEWNFLIPNKTTIFETQPNQLRSIIYRNIISPLKCVDNINISYILNVKNKINFTSKMQKE